MKIAILGFDVEGAVSYAYFKAQGHDLTICDQNPDKVVPEGANRQLGPDYLHGLDRFDLLVRTPGLKPSDILEANPSVAPKITSGTNEFFKASPTRNIIGVTGTKGKGTTSTLIARILEATGKKVFLGGNIGVPALSFLSQTTKNDWVVLELSNFQLIDLQYSPHIAVVLMIIPEHLDWHKDFDEYLNAKRQLVLRQSNDDLTVYNAANPNSIAIARSSHAQKLWYRVDDDSVVAKDVSQGAYVRDNCVFIGETKVCSVDEVALIGRHNLQNVCAAVAATWEATNHNLEAIRSAVLGFSGLPFRLELRRVVDNIRYYNDSFSSGPGSAMAAMEAIDGMKVMIMGGYDRGLDLQELCESVRDHSDQIRKVLIIGASGARLAAELTKAGFTNFEQTDAKDMVAVIQAAKGLASPGDAVVLSPAFASFDMFKNFEDRGIKFNEVVAAL